MSEILHLSTDAFLAIHEQVLKANGGGDGIRDKNLLESALAAPQATLGGEPVMTDHHEIAASYLYYICNNHPFIDGNKRTALAACLVFLDMNGLFDRNRALDVDTWETFVLDVAASRIDRKEATERLRNVLD